MDPYTVAMLCWTVARGWTSTVPWSPWPLAVCLFLALIARRRPWGLPLLAACAAFVVPSRPSLQPTAAGDSVSLEGIRVGPANGREASVFVTGHDPRQRGDTIAVFPYGERLPRAGTRLWMHGRFQDSRQPTFFIQRFVSASAAPTQLADDTTGLLTALRYGDRSAISPSDIATLRNSGTAHLLAVSGFHVGTVAWSVAHFVRLALGLSALRRPAGFDTAPATWALAIAAAAAFTWSVGAPVSAQRATGLLAIWGFARATGRSIKPFAALASVAAMLAAVHPASVWTPSFQLSFGAVAGLIGFTGPLQNVASKSMPWCPSGVARSVAATFAATLGTLPATSYWFQHVAIGAPIANLFALPWTALILLPSAIVASIDVPLLSGLAAAMGNEAARVLLAVLSTTDVGALTPASTAIGSVCLVAGLLMMTRAPSAGATVMAAALSLRPVPREFAVSFFDVGQGDATLVSHPTGHRWLVDAGPTGGRLVQNLRRRGIRRIDVVVATHPHLDHDGGIPSLLQTLRIGEIWANEPSRRVTMAAARSGVPIVQPRRSFPNTPHLSENDRSIVLDVGPLLLTGDISSTRESALLPHLHRPYPLLKVAHHGSHTSTSLPFLVRVQPHIALIGVAGSNRFGHPSRNVLDRLIEYDVTMFRTDVHGDIDLRCGHDPRFAPAHATRCRR